MHRMIVVGATTHAKWIQKMILTQSSTSSPVRRIATSWGSLLGPCSWMAKSKASSTFLTISCPHPPSLKGWGVILLHQRALE